MPLQRNTFGPQGLTAIYTSPSGMTDPITGQPFQEGGLIVGTTIDITEAEAQAQSTSLHTGRYRFIQLDSGATAANVKTGTIGIQKTLAGGCNLITSYDLGLGTGVGLIHPVVFINSPTSAQIAAGCYLWVQEEGDASLLMAGSGTINPGTTVEVTTGGVVTNGTTAGLTLGQAEAAGTISTLFRAQLDLPVVQG